MCKVTASQIQADVAGVDKAIVSIATATQTLDPTLSADLTAAANALTDATANWTEGSPVADINDAAQAIEDLLAAIPVTAPYAVFVSIAVAALDILIANLATQPLQTSSAISSAISNAKAVIAHVESMPPNPYRGKVEIHPGILGFRHALYSKWNGEVEKNPTLGFPKLA